MTVNMTKLTKVCPAIKDIQLDGETDYVRIKAVLEQASIRPENRLVWAIIDQKKAEFKHTAEDFFS